MGVQVLYDLAQQPNIINFSWLPCVIVLAGLLVAIIPWKQLRKNGLRKWAMVYACAMCLSTTGVIAGSIFSYYQDIYRYRNWSHSIKYDAIEGICVLPNTAVRSSCNALWIFQIKNKTFEYGSTSNVNPDVTSEIIKPLLTSKQRVRIYYQDGRILRIEQEENKEELGENEKN